ncbi:MAG: Sirohydrochlorin cobaltochelatase [Firmicutes bacterium]|nr:Sirohydrochlorin cobaltochelatase [Bacillota bacterium]
MSHKKAIIIVSFGTVNDTVRSACIESVENKVKDNFPGDEVRRAFTSNFIIKKLSERQIYVDTLPEALEKLKSEGYQDVIIQSTHLTPGEEYRNKILVVANAYKHEFNSLVVGRPVLMFDGGNHTSDDFLIALQAVRTQIYCNQADTEVVFMGHGSPHQHNPAYELLQKKFDEQKENITVGVLEESDYPNIKDVLARLAGKQNIKKIILMPFLLVAGNHVVHDMTGEQEASWKNILVKAGYHVELYLHGLGENEAFQDIYVQHIKDVIVNRNEKY